MDVNGMKNKFSFKFKNKKNVNKNTNKGGGDIVSNNSQFYIENLVQGVTIETVNKVVEGAIDRIKIDERFEKLELKNKMPIPDKDDIKSPIISNPLFGTLGAIEGKTPRNWAREHYSNIANLLTENDLRYILVVGTLYTATYLVEHNIPLMSNNTIKGVIENKESINHWFEGVPDFETWFNYYSNEVAFQKLRHLGFYDYVPSRDGIDFNTESQEMVDLYNEFPIFDGVKTLGGKTMIVNDPLHWEAIYWILVSLIVKVDVDKSKNK